MNEAIVQRLQEQLDMETAEARSNKAADDFYPSAFNHGFVSGRIVGLRLAPDLLSRKEKPMTDFTKAIGLPAGIIFLACTTAATLQPVWGWFS